MRATTCLGTWVWTMASLGAGVTYGSVIVDDFTVGAMSRDLNSLGTSALSGLPTQNVIGGARVMTFGGIRTLAPAPPANSTVTMSVDTSGDGQFVLDGVPNATPINSGLRYNGSTTITSAMNVDLAPSGETGLVLSFAYANFSPDAAHSDLSITSVSGSFSGFLNLPSSPTPFDFFIPFPTSGGFDKHHVTNISFGTGNGHWYNDFALTGIASGVPEPAGLLLGAAGAGISLGGRRMRRRRGTSALI
jgi:hypothetical protein